MAAKLKVLKLKNVALDDSSDDESDTSDTTTTTTSAAVDDLVGLSLEKLSIGPQKKLLILCLGGLLVQRLHQRHRASVLGRRPDLVCGSFQIFKRPFCDEFLKCCFQRFHVGLWSSAREHNVDDVLSIIGSGIRSKFAFLWDQDDCINSGFHSLENKQKPIFLKDLKKIWCSEDGTSPWPSGKYSSSNTLLIDTDPSKALLNPPNTAIFPREYKLDHWRDNFLGPNGELQRFLDGLVDADEVPSYVKENRLGQPAITAAHPDWSYYKQIVSRFSR